MTTSTLLPFTGLRFRAASLLLLGWIVLNPAVAVEPFVRRIPAADGVLCTVLPPAVSPVRRAQTGLVVHLYGSGGSHQSYNIARPAYADLREMLAARGYWIVVPELGQRHWMNDAACASVDAVIAELVRNENVDPARVHLFGTSMGGGSSLIYVMKRPGKIKSVVAIFPMTDFEQWLVESPKYRSPVEKAHAIDSQPRAATLRQISPLHNLGAFRSTPVFLLHGDADPIVHPHHSRDFAAALKAKGYPVTYREVAGGVHRDDIAQNYQRELADFLSADARR